MLTSLPFRSNNIVIVFGAPSASFHWLHLRCCLCSLPDRVGLACYPGSVSNFAVGASLKLSRAGPSQCIWLRALDRGRSMEGSPRAVEACSPAAVPPRLHGRADPDRRVGAPKPTSRAKGRDSVRTPIITWELQQKTGCANQQPRPRLPTRHGVHIPREYHPYSGALVPSTSFFPLLSSRRTFLLLKGACGRLRGWHSALSVHGCFALRASWD